MKGKRQKERSARRERVKNIAVAPKPQQVQPIKGRILLCSGSLGLGGAERVNVDMANALHSAGYDVHMHLSQSVDGVFRDLLDPAIEPVLTPDPTSIVDNAIRIRPDAILINNSWAHLKQIPDITDACKCKYVGVMIHGFTKWSIDHLTPDLEGRLTNVVAVTDKLRAAVKEHRPYWADRVDVLSNYVDLSMFHPLAVEKTRDLSRYGWDEDSLVIGYEGRFSSEKRLPVLVDIFNFVLQKEPRAKLLLVGGPDSGVPGFAPYWQIELDKVMRRARDLGIGEKVHVTGLVTDPEMHLRNMDVFMLTSRSEGSPLALLEAMACGIPAVCTEVGDISETFAACKCGVTYKTQGTEFVDGDKTQFADTVIRMLESPDRPSMGRAGAEYVKAHHSLDAYRKNVVKYFKNKIENPGHSTIQAQPLKPGMLDLTDLVTVFVSTVGSLEFDACIDALKNQDCRFKMRVIRNVAPMNAAFQQMIDTCTTPYYVQVDEDMHLHTGAIRTLYEGIVKAADNIVLYCRPLYEPFREFIVDGVKIYRHELMRRYPYSGQAAFCEMTQISRFHQDGLDIAVFPHSKDYVVGDLNLSWTPEFHTTGISHDALYGVYEKFRRDALKSRMAGSGIGWVDKFADKMLKESDKTPFHKYASFGIVAGLIASDLPKGEKDYRDKTARLEFDRLVKAYGTGAPIPLKKKEESKVIAPLTRPVIKVLNVPIDMIGIEGSSHKDIRELPAVQLFLDVLNGSPAKSCGKEYQKILEKLLEDSGRQDAKKAVKLRVQSLTKASKAGNPLKDPLPARVNANGRFELLDGHHRAAQAIVDKVEDIPLAVHYASPIWSDLERRLQSIYKDPDKLYQRVEHPWFADWEVSRDDTRGETIINALRRMEVPRHNLLDIGCCTGRLCRLLSNEGFSVYGVDRDANVIAIADHLNIVFDKHVNYTVASDIRQVVTGCGMSPSNVVVCLSVLHHYLWEDNEAEYVNTIKLFRDNSKVFFIDHVNEEDISLIKTKGIPTETPAFTEWLKQHVPYCKVIGIFNERPMIACSKTVDIK